MAANENTKFQINYKLNDGTLINLYATDVKDLETGLTDLSMVSALIKSTSTELGGVPAQAAPTVAAVAQAFNATPVAAPASQPGAKSCKHGAMTFKSGTNERGTWQGYMCPTPKGAPDKCETIWVR